MTIYSPNLPDPDLIQAAAKANGLTEDEVRLRFLSGVWTLTECEWTPDPLKKKPPPKGKGFLFRR